MLPGYFVTGSANTPISERIGPSDRGRLQVDFRPVGAGIVRADAAARDPLRRAAAVGRYVGAGVMVAIGLAIAIYATRPQAPKDGNSNA